MKKSMKKAEHEQIQLQKSSLKSQRHIVTFIMILPVYPVRYQYVTLSN